MSRSFARYDLPEQDFPVRQQVARGVVPIEEPYSADIRLSEDLRPAFALIVYPLIGAGIIGLVAWWL